MSDPALSIQRLTWELWLYPLGLGVIRASLCCQPWAAHCLLSPNSVSTFVLLLVSLFEDVNHITKTLRNIAVFICK